jgi:hypothetical protein
MTTSPNTTPSLRATDLNPLLAPDRILFRSALDHLSDALKADWQFFLRRKQSNSPEALEFGHQAAQAWSLCLEALRETRDIEAVHPDLRAAAVEIIQTTPGFYPHASELIKCVSALRPLSEQYKSQDLGLHDLLFQAYVLCELHYANIVFVQPPVRS